ncbi:hypothetical protein B0H12DRAFT_1122574 [Mycena haematopus]|nr:hypothetical protein B0H12DRAFT_1122574 [Mycena haematopus]
MGGKIQGPGQIPTADLNAWLQSWPRNHREVHGPTLRSSISVFVYFTYGFKSCNLSSITLEPPLVSFYSLFAVCSARLSCRVSSYPPRNVSQA